MGIALIFAPQQAWKRAKTGTFQGPEIFDNLPPVRKLAIRAYILIGKQ